MNIVLKNIHKYDSTFYKGIEINEISEESKYLVKFFGKDISVDSNKDGGKLSDRLLGLSPEDQIREIINHYIDNTTINYFTGIIPEMSCYQNMCFRANGTRYLFFNIHNKKLRLVMENVLEKYKKDRDVFCSQNRHVNAIKFDIASFSSYEMVTDKLCFDNDKVEKIMKFAFKTNLNDFVLESEYNFIVQFLIERFSLYDEEVKKYELYDSKYRIKGYLLVCGDLRIYFPKFRNLLWILGMVDNYNRDLKEKRKNVKRRQLKKEEF